MTKKSRLFNKFKQAATSSVLWVDNKGIPFLKKEIKVFINPSFHWFKAKFVPSLKEKSYKIVYPSLHWIKNELTPFIQKRSEIVTGKTVRWVKHELTPTIQKRTESVVERLVKEDGIELWSALSPSSKWSSKLVYILVGVSSFGIVWASFASIDETVQAQGKLEPIGTTIDVKVPLGGVIKQILVKEGELVEMDQTLLKLDTTAVASKLKSLKKVRSQILADITLSKIQLGDDANIDNLNDNQKLKLKSLLKEYNSRIEASKSAVEQSELQMKSIVEKKKTMEEILLIREGILNSLRPLFKEGGISKVQFLKEKQEVMQLRSQKEALNIELKRFTEVLRENKNKLLNTIAATEIDFSTKIEENTKQVAQLDNQISEANLTLSYQEIKSPLDGLVFDLQAAAPGFVVNSNLPLLKIVPVDDLVARVFVQNRDIGFLKKGQEVKIRLDAYPYSEFGEIKGKIKSIGSDVLEPDDQFNFFRFPVTVSLDEPFLEHKNNKLPLITGMSLSVNVILRQRPVISLFTERVLPFWDGLEQMK